MDVPLVEPAIVPDLYVSGLAYVDELENDNFRLTYFTKQRSTYDGGSHDMVIVARLVVSREVIIKNITKIMTALGVSCCGGERLKRLAH